MAATDEVQVHFRGWRAQGAADLYALAGLVAQAAEDGWSAVVIEHDGSVFVQ